MSSNIFGRCLTVVKKVFTMTCECPQLRTISLIIAGLNVLFSALFSIRVIVHLAVYHHLEREILEKDKAVEKEIKLGFSTLLFLLIFGAMWFFSSLLLVKGIVQERFKLMSWWIYLNYFTMAVIFGSAVIAFVTDLIYWTTAGDVFKKLLLYLLGSGFSFLLFWPVFKLYKRLQFNTEQQALRESEEFKATSPDNVPNKFYEEENQLSSEYEK